MSSYLSVMSMCDLLFPLSFDLAFLDGYCSTIQGVLDWFEVDLGFPELVLFRLIRVFCVFLFFYSLCHSILPFNTWPSFLLPLSISADLIFSVNFVDVYWDTHTHTHTHTRTHTYNHRWTRRCIVSIAVTSARLKRCDLSHLYVWYDAFIRVTRLHMRDVT